MLWSGTIATIPEGWHLCDGTHGTPDMRDQFSLSAGPSFRARTSGGASSHTHDFTTNTHFHRISLNSSIQTGPVDIDPTLITKPATGETDTTPNLPPYYSLAYIMRLPN